MGDETTQTQQTQEYTNHDVKQDGWEGGVVLWHQSKLELLVGRRLPTLVVLAILFLYCVYMKESQLAATILGVVGIIAKGYLDDIQKEKMALL